MGKGRDVGMQQIYKFEAKLSQGAAEQTLSRDVNRLGDRLDFFRLMSFYFGGLGYVFCFRLRGPLGRECDCIFCVCTWYAYLNSVL